jgi:hypothetical protein
LQHFEQTSKYYSTYEELEKPLKKHLLNYEKTEKFYKNQRNDIYKKLKPTLQDAIKNAQNLCDFTFDNTHTGIAEMYKIFILLGLFG